MLVIEMLIEEWKESCGNWLVGKNFLFAFRDKCFKYMVSTYKLDIYQYCIDIHQVDEYGFSDRVTIGELQTQGHLEAETLAIAYYRWAVETARLYKHFIRRR